MASAEDLRRLLARIDGRGYRAYKEIAGHWELPDLALHIDHVQGDPFAAPSKLRLRVPASAAGLPPELHASPTRRVGLADFLARAVAAAIRGRGRSRRGSGGSGAVSIDAGGQEVLERTAVVVEPAWVEARVEAGLPAAGRRVLGREAARLLCEELPRIAREGLHWASLSDAEGRRFVECVENQEAIRARLADRDLVAFVADGAILPRASGVSDRPLAAPEAVPFRSPASLRIVFEVPNPLPGGGREIAGMGIPRGVTLIVGGGYHGKSTLLRALVRGVYPHIPGDGREGVVTDAAGVAVRAEDGRRVEGVDIRPFIGELPGGRRTDAFATDDASGSTSQAAGIVEAVEAGATLLLMDEDTSATNFMVRDARMQALVRAPDEPITPFVDRVRELHERWGVSTVLVMGGCGDYFDVADTVIALRSFCAADVGEEARAVAAQHPTGRQVETPAPLAAPGRRVPLPEGLDASKGRRGASIRVRDRDELGFGTQSVDLRAVEQLVDASQTRAVGCAMALARERLVDGTAGLREVVEAVDALIDAEGLDALDPHHRPGRHPGNLARPRRFELAAAIDRLRSLRVRR